MIRNRHWKPIVGIAIGVTAVVSSAFWHQAHGDGHDFLAYYKAAQRYLDGYPFYVFEGVYAFKYAPLSVFYFLPFTLWEYDTARWIYASLHAAAALCVPALLWGLLRSDPVWRVGLTQGKFLAALGVAFLGTFRFVDGELRSSNVGLFVTLSILAGALALTSKKMRPFAPLIMGSGAIVKVHPLISWLAFRFWEKRTFWALAGACALLFLVPHPNYWWDWVAQMRNTQGAMPLSPGNYNLQGFQSFAERFLGWDPHGSRSLWLASPFLVMACWGLPRFSLEQAGRQPVCLFLTAGAWALLALMCSPLPWQHTYSLVWALWPLSWLTGNPLQKKILLALSIGLGLSPRDISGPILFSWLEGNQSVFLLILSFWLLLFFQIRSMKESL